MKNLCLTLFAFAGLVARSQTICNSSGNLMLFTNYDGGTLTINVDQNIPNLKIGICSYEACVVSLSGAFVNNVTEVRYAGYNNSNNSACGSPAIPTTTILGAPGSASTSIVFAPASPVANSNGYGSIICGYSCNNSTSQGGCNTVDQVEGYFLGYFTGSTLFAHKVQYGCWTGTQSLSIGGNCCPPPPIYPGSVTASQTLCSGATPAPFLSTAQATVSAGTIGYQWQSSTTSTSTGFTSIFGATSATYAPLPVTQTTYYRRAASTATNNIVFGNVITVSVLPLPLVAISGPTAVCTGSSATLTASGGTAYAWSQGTAAGASVVITPTVSTAITVTCFAANGCSATAIKVLVVNAQPTLIVAGVTACYGKTATLTALGGTSHTWQPGNLSGASVTVVALASQVYTVMAANSSGCASTSTVQLTVNPLPVLSVSSTSSPVCSWQSFSLTASGASLYNWRPGQQSGSVIQVTLSASTVFTLTGTLNGCKDSISVPITVLPSPTLSVSYSRAKICKTESVVLTAGGAASYSLLNTSAAMASNTLALSPTVTTSYSVTGTATNGCVGMAVETITVSGCTGIGSAGPLNQPGIQVYPNPNSGECFISSKEAASLDVINNAGQWIKHLELHERNNYMVSLKNLPAGIYFLVSQNQDFRQKIVVTK